MSVAQRSIVRYREGGRQRQRTFQGKGHKRRADIFKGEVQRRKEMGGLEFLVASQETLSDFAEGWLRVKAPNLSENTIRSYAYVLDTHIDPFLGGYKLSELRPKTLMEWQASRLNAGAGREQIGKAGMVLHGILKKAVALELLPSNPAAVLERPKVVRRPKRPLSPEEVEGMRSRLLEADKLGGAVLVSLLAYAGLRPYSEALARTWGDVTDTLLVDTHVVEGQIIDGTKTELGGVRSVKLLAPLKEDLALWREATAGQDDELIFPRRKDGEPWTREDYSNWRNRTFKKVAPDGVNPKDLRDTFVSLLIWEGRPVTYVARQAGHSPNVCLRNYAHIMEQVEQSVPAETLIRKARAA